MVYNLGGDHSSLNRSLSETFSEDHCCNLSMMILNSKNWLILSLVQRNPKFIWIKFFVTLILHIVVFYADLVKDVMLIVVYAEYVEPSASFR